MTDGELLRRYARQRSETAFEELVRRRITLVYSAALRQVNNDAHLAEDVTQAVFTDLARKAAKLSRHPSLTAWLYTSTRYIAANVRRAEHRRVAREKAAHAMNAIHPTPESESEPDWSQIRPLLDDAMHELDAEACQAVLLRHFERCSYAEIAGRLGLTEDSARMRVNRALEKLHETLAKRGVTSTAVALAALLTRNAVGAVPAYLPGKTARAAIARAGVAGSQGTFLTSKIAVGLAPILLVASAIIFIVSRLGGARTSDNNTAVDLSTNADMPAVPVAGDSAVAGLSAPADDAVLHLQIITADTGKPIPDVPIVDFNWGWQGQAMYSSRTIKQRELRSDRLGRCDVHYSTNDDRLELMTADAPFADTRARWQRPLGDVIPTNYILRVERAAPIGGTVIDADGNPIPDATVTWNLSVPDASVARSPITHELYGTSYQTTTDQAGRWQINRIAGPIIPYLVGDAKESNYVDSDSISTARDTSAKQQLLADTYAIKLGRPVTAEGLVVDADGKPIQGATIQVGNRHGASSSDGTFSVVGCVPGKQRIVASASGFPSAGMTVDISQVKAIRMILRPGKSVTLRIVDNAGKPIPEAVVFATLSPVDRDAPEPWFATVNPQSQQSDKDGRVTWPAAPDTEIRFTITVPGPPNGTEEDIRPDGQEHVITISSIPR